MNNKKTWLLVECFKRTSGAMRERLNHLLSLSEENAAEKIEGVQKLYIEAGIKEAAEEAIAQYHKKALAIIEQLELNAAQKEQLTAYANYLINRNK
jgi:geranylgeranyl pyrophosphate synthase